MLIVIQYTKRLDDGVDDDDEIERRYVMNKVKVVRKCSECGVVGRELRCIELDRVG
jgi:hypothetical protein